MQLLFLETVFGKEASENLVSMLQLGLVSGVLWLITAHLPENVLKFPLVTLILWLSAVTTLTLAVGLLWTIAIVGYLYALGSLFVAAIFYLIYKSIRK